MSFLALSPAFDPTYASLGQLEHAAEDVPLSRLRRGLLVGIELGRKARFERSKEAFQFGPSGKRTPASRLPVDLFRNHQTGCLVVSPRLGEALANLDPALQLVRVGLKDIDGLDHGFVVTAPLVDALDLAASKAKVERADDEIVRARSLVLRPAAVPAERVVFRVPLLDDYWFIREAARQALAGFTGLELSDPATIRIGD